MTALAWAALVVGLLCVPISDPVVRRRVRALRRLRRIRSPRVNQHLGVDVTALEKTIRDIDDARLRHLKSGHNSLAANKRRQARRLRRELVRLRRSR